jgi:MYXO-CTERM domain-containing protein
MRFSMTPLNTPSALRALVAAATLACALPAMADVTATSHDLSLDVGQTKALTLDIDVGTGVSVAAFDFRFTFDPALFSVSFLGGTYLGSDPAGTAAVYLDGTPESFYDVATSTFSLSWLGNADLVLDGPIKLNLEVKNLALAPQTHAALTYSLGYTDGSFKDYTVSVNNSVISGVPEPTTWALGLVGLGVAALSARRASRQAELKKAA